MIDFCDDDVKLYCDAPADSASSLAEPVFPTPRPPIGTQCSCSMIYNRRLGNRRSFSSMSVQCSTNEYHTSAETWTTVETEATETETQPSIPCACDQSSGDESSAVGAGVFTGTHSVISRQYITRLHVGSSLVGMLVQ